MKTEPATLHLMIVDDDPRTRRALAAFVSGLKGLSVVAEAKDGQDAIEQLGLRHADVVLMDCRMPRLDGIEATRLIKERWPQVKVIILTLYQERQPEAQAAGADAVLLKGCSAEEFAATVRAVALG